VFFGGRVVHFIIRVNRSDGGGRQDYGTAENLAGDERSEFTVPAPIGMLAAQE